MSGGSEENDFETGTSGAADCVPTQVGSIKKGGYCMLKGNPCKVTEYSTAKPGKHGSAKATIVGKNISLSQVLTSSPTRSMRMEDPLHITLTCLSFQRPSSSWLMSMRKMWTSFSLTAVSAKEFTSPSMSLSWLNRSGLISRSRKNPLRTSPSWSLSSRPVEKKKSLRSARNDYSRILQHEELSVIPR